MSLIPSPYLTLAKYAAIAAAMSFMVGASYRHGVTTARAQAAAEISAARKERIAEYEKELRTATQRQFNDDARMDELLMRLSDVRADQVRLVSLVVPLTSKKTEAPNAHGQCDVTVLSDAFGMCWNAAITGAIGATAACEAYSRDGVAPADHGASGVQSP